MILLVRLNIVFETGMLVISVNMTISGRTFYLAKVSIVFS